MKKIIGILPYLLLPIFLFGQKGQLRVMQGIMVNSKLFKDLPYDLPVNDAYIKIEAINPIITKPFALLLTQKISKNVNMSVGFITQSKGFEQEGFISNQQTPSIKYPYKREYKIGYWGFLAGFDYSLLKRNKWDLKLEYLLNLDIPKKDEYIERIGLSSILLLDIDRKLNNKFTLSILPTFQTAFYRYDKPDIYFDENHIHFFPFGFGLNAGLKYNLY